VEYRSRDRALPQWRRDPAAVDAAMPGPLAKPRRWTARLSFGRLRRVR
jgi:hypothetical protein